MANEAHVRLRMNPYKLSAYTKVSLVGFQIVSGKQTAKPFFEVSGPSTGVENGTVESHTSAS